MAAVAPMKVKATDVKQNQPPPPSVVDIKKEDPQPVPKRYHFLCSDTYAGLAELVDTKMNEGWTLHGYPFNDRLPDSSLMGHFQCIIQPPPKMEYGIHVSQTSELADREISALLSVGWIPVGVVAVDKDDYVYQAVKRRLNK